MNSANSHMRRATAIVSKIMREFERSVFDLHRHLDAVREDLEQTGRSLIGRSARMPDGSIYAGRSPDTGKAMYATPKDAKLTMKWKAAMEYAAKLDAHGHDDWRVPTKRELDVLFNRAEIGGFNESGSDPAGWYWSSSQDDNDGALGQRFSDGHRNYYDKHHVSSLRCVR